MSLRYKAIIGAFLLSILGALAWSASHYHDKYQAERLHAEATEQRLVLANTTITDMQTRQRDVTALDAKYTKELADANAENAALQRKLDNGGRVLVKGKCPVPAATETASASGVGHDATVELSDVAGRNVLGIRSGIKQDQSALIVLQEYVRTQCLN